MFSFRKFVNKVGSLFVVLVVSFLSFGTVSAVAITGDSGQSLVADRVVGLDPAGETVKVSGSGYDLSKGIYLAVCVDNGVGVAPNPCVGGVNMSGDSKTSFWISSNPPEYAANLTVPFVESAGQGSFEESLLVQASDGEVDCLDSVQAPQGCVISTRADHLRADDRSADVFVPVSFVGSVEGITAISSDDLGNNANYDSNGSNSGVFLGFGVVVVVLFGLGAFARRKRSS